MNRYMYPLSVTVAVYVAGIVLAVGITNKNWGQVIFSAIVLVSLGLDTLRRGKLL